MYAYPLLVSNQRTGPPTPMADGSAAFKLVTLAKHMQLSVSESIHIGGGASPNSEDARWRLEGLQSILPNVRMRRRNRCNLWMRRHMVLHKRRHVRAVLR